MMKVLESNEKNASGIELGVAEGKYKIPSDINVFDQEIAEMFNKSSTECNYVDSAYGMLSKYADSNKIPLEEGAFERAMVKKNELNKLL